MGQSSGKVVFNVCEDKLENVITKTEKRLQVYSLFVT